MPTPEEKRQRRIERTVEKFRELRPVTQKKRVLAKLQRIVKLKALSTEGTLTCVTCGAVHPMGRKMNAGHFISRKYWGTCFDRRNIHPQCVKCNDHLKGNLGEYRKFMLQFYGPETVEELESLAGLERSQDIDVILMIEELAEMYVEFSDELKELEAK